MTQNRPGNVKAIEDEIYKKLEKALTTSGGGGGGKGVTSTHNKRGCAILTKKVTPKNPGTYLKLRPKNPELT